MSRIGRQPIQIPDKVKVALAGSIIKIEGPKGKAELSLPAHVAVAVDAKQVVVTRGDETRQSRSLHGLTRSLINNFIEGVAKGYQRNLEINGVGFKADVRGKEIHFSIGFSHPVVFPLPAGVSAEWRENKTAEKQGDLSLKSHDKDLLGRTAAKVRALRPPEPYKGKGIRYAEETVRRKVGKTGAA